MTQNEVIKIFKCLADKSRLQILKSLTDEPMYVERLAERLKLASSTISFHLKKLEEAGLVCSEKDQYYTVYSIRKELLQLNLLELIQVASPSEEDLQKEREQTYRKKVLDSFFEYGKLKAIPVQRKKERIILEEIAKAFEMNKDYTEKEVNLIIADYFDDFCTIRRDMISEGILIRENSTYRKC